MKIFLSILIGVWILFGAPILGGLSSGMEFYDTINFKLGSITDSEPFNWWWFVTISIFGVLVLYVMVKEVYSKYQIPIKIKSFPKFGYFWLLLLTVTWILYWTELDETKALTRIAFPILWISFVMLLGNITAMYKTKSDIMVLKNFLFLFIFSSIFWWYFEFLNQFTGNWNYTTLNHLFDMSPKGALIMSIAFATVLLGEMAILEVFCCKSGFVNKVTIEKFKVTITTSLSLIISGTAVLFLMPIFPHELFPALWVAPIFILIGVQGVFLGHFKYISFGGAKLAFMFSASAISSLICGFFWEMWNYYNSGGWSYTVPYIDRYNIFEMPLLGYLGYLPFGLESMLFCALIFSISESPQTKIRST